MLANNYKNCFWKANGELDCSGMEGSIGMPVPYQMYSPCQSLIPPPTCNFNLNYNLTPQIGGSDPARFYAQSTCPQPSGPVIAAGGFGPEAQWVSPSYYQPPNDYHPPQNAYYPQTYEPYPTQEKYNRTCSTKGTYSEQMGGKSKKGPYVQSKLSKSFYQPNESRKPQIHGNGQVEAQPAPMPEGVFPHWKPDLRYRENLQNIPAQNLYENILSGYNQEPLYTQTDMNYVQLQQGIPQQDAPVFSAGMNPIAYWTQPVWGTQGTNEDISGYTSLDSNPNLNLDTTLNTGNELTEAFQESPLLSGTTYQTGGFQDSRYNASVAPPSYATILQSDQDYLQPLANQNGGGFPPSEFLSVAPSNPAPVPIPKTVNWRPQVRAKLRNLTKELGPPYLIDRKSGGFALWNQSSLKKRYLGIFKRIELHDEEIHCEEPYPHNRNLYTWIRIDIPSSEIEKLYAISPNIIYDRTKKWLCISGSTLRGNLALLTLICMFLQHKVSCYQIDKYELQKKYLLAMNPKSGLYHPGAKKAFLNTIHFFNKKTLF